MGISSSIVGKLYLNHDMHNLYLNEVKTHTNLAILYFITKRKLYINDSLSNIDFHINSDSQKIAKYNKNESSHFLPARISNSEYKFLIKISKEIFRVCNCKGIARIDYIMSKKNRKIFFLEMNTHPGLTKLSLAPEQANYKGLSYLYLLKQIINSSL